MDMERVCCNCNYFMPDKKDFDIGYGACLFDMEEFEQFVDEIYEDNDFSSCMQSYNDKRIDGDSEVCENYEQVEIVENECNVAPEEIEYEIMHFALQTQSVEKFAKLVVSENVVEKRYAINELIRLSYFDNKMAYETLLNYFLTSEQAKTLEEVNWRVKLIEALQHKAKKEELIGHYINELLKTPSNNTTRKIFHEIFRYFEGCTLEIIEEPLMDYLQKGKCKPKLKGRVLGIIDKLIERERPRPYFY